MRAFLSGGVRPRIGQPQSIISRSTKTIIRETTVTPPRRRLTFCDAFTILLAPVLTAVFVIDFARKDTRRQEWGQKIAVVQREIDALRDREMQVWENLQCDSIRVGVVHQRRNYSTSRIKRFEQDQARDSEMVGDRNSSPQSPIYYPTNVTASLADLQNFEHLLAVKVGLQLLLHVSTGRDDAIRTGSEDFAEATAVPDDMEALMKHLKTVNFNLRQQKRKVVNSTADLALDTPERQRLDAQVSEFTWKCRTGLINVTELIYQYTKAVMSSRTGLSLNAYQNLVETFSTLDSDALTFIAMYPYFKTKQVLSDQIVANIIQQYGKVRDGARLNRFLLRLTQENRGFQLATTWAVVDVGGVKVPSPVNRHPRTLDLLIRGALQGDQPHKANAWTMLLIQGGVLTRRLASVFHNFITYCAKHDDWVRGEMWLTRTITFASYFAKTSPWMLQTLIFRLLDLCVACRKLDYYKNILNAAVAAGLDAPSVDETRPDAFSDQAREILSDWRNRINEDKVTIRGINQSSEAARMFQMEMAKVNSAIADYVGIGSMRELQIINNRQKMPRIPPDAIKSHLGPHLHEGTPWISPSDMKTPEEIMGWTPFLSASSSLTDQRSSSISDSATTIQTSRQQSESIGSECSRNYTIAQHDTKTAKSSALRENSVRELIFGGDSVKEYELQDTVGKMLDLQEQNFQYRERQAHLQIKMDKLETQNSELKDGLEMASQNRDELLKVIDQLKTQLNQPKPKSLESVFLEKENFNLRFELRILSERFSAATVEQETLKKQLSTSKANYEQLAQKTTRESTLLREDNETLHGRLDLVNSEFERRGQVSKAREGHLKSILGIREEKINELCLELSKLKSTNLGSPMSTTTTTTTTPDHKFEEKGQAQQDCALQNQPFTLRYSKTGSKGPRQHSSDDDFVLSSSWNMGRSSA